MTEKAIYSEPGVIRELMKRTAKFVSLSGLSGDHGRNDHGRNVKK